MSVKVHSLRIRCPNPCHRRAALRAGALRGELVIREGVSQTPDEGMIALRVESRLVILHPSRQVAGIDVVQTGLTSDVHPHYMCRELCGSKASRIPSPIRLMHRMVKTMNRLG